MRPTRTEVSPSAGEERKIQYVSAWQPENEPSRDISISHAEEKFLPGMTVSDLNDLQDGRLRRKLVWPMIVFFIAVNLFVDAFVVTLAQSDITLLREHLINPAERLITSQIIVVLIGATAVQLGAIAFGMFRSLFAIKGPNDAETSPPV